jgi:hypothetical protein
MLAELVALGICAVVLAPCASIALSGRGSSKERLRWSLWALLPIPVAAGAWLLAVSVAKPADVVHSGFTAAAGMIAIWGPWLVFAAFRKRARRMPR